MQGDPLNVFMQKSPEDAALSFYAGLPTSDFVLFDYIKQKLTEYDPLDQQSLKNVIARVSDEIGQKILVSVFEI
jgi:hypothetical protein